MDTKSPSQASSSFNQNIPARPRRRPYLIIAVFLGLALIAYYVQPRTKDQEVSLLPYTEDLRPCDLNEPVRRVAIIGKHIFPWNPLLSVVRTKIHDECALI